MLKVCVPATSANLGSGFDCVGVALNLYNELYFWKDEEISLPDGTNLLNKDSLAHQGMSLVAEKIGQKLPDYKIAIKAFIPSARGLGSSATLTVAGVVAGNILLNANLKEEELISLASKVEGHPDNAAPALVGGLVISVTSGQEIKYIKIKPQNSPQVIVVVPDFKVATMQARKVLPPVVPYKDAVFNLGRFGLLMTSFLTENYSLLGLSMEDRLHQPYRVSLVPGLNEVMSTAMANGALGCCLSGAGPTVLAFCDQKAEEIGKAIKDKWKDLGVSAKTYLLEISVEGTKVYQS